MFDQVIGVIALLLTTVILFTYFFPFGVLFTLFRMSDAQIRQMDHYLDYPSVFFDDATGGKDYVAVMGVNLVSSVLLTIILWEPIVLGSVVILAIGMLGPMSSYGSQKRHA